MDQEALDKIMAMTTAESTLPGRMGIKILSASASRVVATMPVLGNVQPHRLLHGGASCVLAETIGSLGAFLHAGVSPMVAGIEISATPLGHASPLSHTTASHSRRIKGTDATTGCQTVALSTWSCPIRAQDSPLRSVLPAQRPVALFPESE